MWKYSYVGKTYLKGVEWMSDKKFSLLSFEYGLFEDNETGKGFDIEKCVELLNSMYEENEQLKFELHTHKHPLWSTREAERKVNELTTLLMNETKKNAILLKEINSLRIENMRLKELRND